MENNILLSILLVIVGLIIGAGIVFIINLIKKNNAKAAYKCMRNSRSDYPILNVSVSNTNGNFKICVGARPQRATVAVKASEFLSNNELNNENIIKASKIAAEELSFGSNMRASREYRKAICISLVKNALMEVSSCQIQ